MRPQLRRSLAAAALIAGGLASREASAEPCRFTKGPYLSALGQTSAVVRWEGTLEVGGTVQIRPEHKMGPVRELKTEVKSHFHAVEIGGLEPGTAYTYTVTSDDGVKSEAGRLVTAPPDDAKSLSFIVYGDNRSDDAAHGAVVKALLRAPSDFLINTGDMVEEGNDDDDWAAFFRIETPLLRDRCLFACVGNHEMVGGNVIRYLRYAHPPQRGGEPTLFYSMRWGNSRFFFLNAFAGWASSADRAWLDGELTRADGEPGLEHRFVVTHHSPFSAGPHGPNREMIKASLPNLLRSHRVTLVFGGHDHLYERGELEGLRYLISGGGGAPLYKPRRDVGPSTIVVEPVHHFIEVKVDGRSITTHARRVDGSTLEACSLDEKGWSCDGALRPVVHPPPASSASASSPLSQPSTAKKACDCSTPGRPSSSSSPLLPLAALLALRGRRLLRAAKLS